MKRKPSKSVSPAKAKAAATPFSPDRKGNQIYGSRNRMIGASVQSSDRKTIPPLHYDFHRNISSYGRETLMTLGRWIFWNFPALHGAVLEQANLAVSTFVPQYKGRNKAWGEQAESWLREWYRVMDIAGWPYDRETYVRNQVIAPLVDCDCGTLLTETVDGYPLIQTIPAHRIKSASGETAVEAGEFKGNRIIDGCIVDAYGRVLAYRLLNDDQTNTDVPARDMFLSFAPIVTGQLRGVSGLASSAFYWQDVAESREFELLAQKAFSTQTILETNESGDADGAQKLIQGGTFDSNGNLTAKAQERLDGGTIRYLKAGSGAKIEPFDWDRPTANVQQFQETVLRDAFRGAEWDAFFSLDPKAIGGAPMRIIVEKINATLIKRRQLVEKACRRVDGYAISKAIKLGLLPNDVDWWMWEYQGPGDISADLKYDSDVALQNIASGIGTRKDAIAKQGGYIEEVDRQRFAEADSDLSRAKVLADKYGLSIQEALTVLMRTGSYSSITNATVRDPSQADASTGATT